MAIKTFTCKNQIFNISYEIINQNQQNSIIFLHGWGSNKNIMKQSFESFFKDYKLIFIDLPGFGNSDLKKSMNSYEFSEVLKHFLDILDIKIQTIIGHSFGGKIATLLKPENLILLSSAGIVCKKSLHVRFKIAIFKILKTFGLNKSYTIFASKDVKGMNKIMYETLKKVVDEKFDDIFKSYNGKAMIFWGKDDTATPLTSGQNIHELIKNSKFFPLDGDHFFFLKQNQQIANIIKENI